MPIGKVEPIPIKPNTPRTFRGIKASANAVKDEVTLDVEFTTTEVLHDISGGSVNKIPKKRLRAFLRRLDGVDDFAGDESATPPLKAQTTPATFTTTTTLGIVYYTYRFEFTVRFKDDELPTWGDSPGRASILVKRASPSANQAKWVGNVMLDPLSANGLILTPNEEANLLAREAADEAAQNGVASVAPQQQAP